MLLYVVHRSKGLIAVFSILLSLVIVIGSTYAWQTDSDEKLNRTGEKSGQLEVQLEEEYQPNLAWQPGNTTKKEVAAKNYGKYSAFVRISLFEFLTYFETDVHSATGDGSLSYVSSSAGTDINVQDPRTWAVGNTYKLDTGKYATVKEVYKSDLTVVATATEYQGSTAPHEALNYRTINYHSGTIYSGTLPAGASDYWYYDQGYFYYSERLELGEVTQPLIDSVSLSDKTPNQYKAALYQLVPKLEAHDASKSLISDWELTGTPMETMYQDKLK